MTKPLSPAAQSVLDAANGFNSYSPDDVLNESRWIVAAALRAVADQLTPEQVQPPCRDDFAYGEWFARNDMRDDLLRIAKELEAQ